MILGMMILPLPPMLLDLLFTFNIALSVMVLLVSMYTMKPLDFAAFPSVLLFSTLLRLSLNVASTRVVLLEGHTGRTRPARDRGVRPLPGRRQLRGRHRRVRDPDDHQLHGDHEGRGRIAEVSARFTLDAMPGKQMAIDADLNAGLINEEQARKRRLTVSQEAEFYGSMDGASSSCAATRSPA